MNNWHRRMWKLELIPAGSFIHELYDAALENSFWFEPVVAAEENALQFRVRYLGNAMTSNWARVTVQPKGDQPFASVGAADDTTERLEGAIDLEDAPLPLKFYINKNVTPHELVLVVGEGSGGGAGVGKGHDNS